MGLPTLAFLLRILQSALCILLRCAGSCPKSHCTAQEANAAVRGDARTHDGRATPADLRKACPGMRPRVVAHFKTA
jgi:hypothetical protein